MPMPVCFSFKFEVFLYNKNKKILKCDISIESSRRSLKVLEFFCQFFKAWKIHEKKEGP